MKKVEISTEIEEYQTEIIKLKNKITGLKKKSIE